MPTSSTSGPPGGVAYLATARLGEKGQITVPKEYRDAFNLEAGAPFSILRLGGSLLLIPEQSHFRQLCDRIAETFAAHRIQADEILHTLPDTRQRVFARHYPKLSARKSAPQKKTRA